MVYRGTVGAEQMRVDAGALDLRLVSRDEMLEVAIQNAKDPQGLKEGIVKVKQ
ncbi:hypothetical protein TrRE_jg7798, partial [Triparma retinervis]